MILLNFLKALAIHQSIEVKQRTAMISFDEGPSKNIKCLLTKASAYKIPVVLHLDPTLESFTGDLVNWIVCSGFEVGLAVTEKLDEDENNIKEVLTRFTNAFIAKTNRKPVLLRLPTIGILSEKAYEIAEEMGYVVTTPTLDSEDDEKTNIWPFIVPALQRLCRDPVSIVFRDRYLRSIYLLPSIAGLIFKRGYRILPAYAYLGISTKLIPVEPETNPPTNSSPFVLKMSTNLSDNTINVTASDSQENLIKQLSLPLNTENKLRVRDALKKKIVKEGDLDLLFNDLEQLKEDKKVHTANQNGVDGCLLLRAVMLNVLVGNLF